MVDATKGARVDDAGRTVTLSRVLLWFAEDFKVQCRSRDGMSRGDLAASPLPQ